MQKRSGRRGCLPHDRHSLRPRESDQGRGAPADGYWWSSYAEYARAPIRCKTERALDIIGSRERLIALHGTELDRLEPGVREHRGSRELGDDELTERAITLLGKDDFRRLKKQPEEQRGRVIGILHASGLSIRQVERAMSIGRSIISRAKCDRMT